MLRQSGLGSDSDSASPRAARDSCRIQFVSGEEFGKKDHVLIFPHGWSVKPPNNALNSRGATTKKKVGGGYDGELKKAMGPTLKRFQFIYLRVYLFFCPFE
jgi:hypothetical protein